MLIQRPGSVSNLNRAWNRRDVVDDQLEISDPNVGRFPDDIEPI